LNLATSAFITFAFSTRTIFF